MYFFCFQNILNNIYHNKVNLSDKIMHYSINRIQQGKYSQIICLYFTINKALKALLQKTIKNPLLRQY